MPDLDRISPEQAFARGQEAGIVKARLDGHDAHLAIINGSISRFANEMKNLSSGIQVLAAEARARDATTLATALALEKADKARREAAERVWTPIQRLSLVIGTIGTFIAAILALGVHT